MKQQRFKLTIALKIVDRKKNEIFIVDNTTNEKNIDNIIADNETIKKNIEFINYYIINLIIIKIKV